MKTYCLNSSKNAATKNPRVTKANNGRIMLLSKCEVSDSKKSRFIKNQISN